MSSIYIILGIILVLVLWAVFAYNRFVSLVNRAKEAWSDIDVQLKRRYDLIPNLVETVKGYAKHESSAFENVTKARASAMGAGTLAEKGQAENMLVGALKSVFAIAEAYPDLKANQNFLALQSQLEGTENRITVERRRFNEVARQFNTKIRVFPQNWVAGWIGLQKKAYFAADEAAKVAPTVKF